MSDLARLIMLQGQQNADWQREKYDRLGSAVSNLGATIGGAIEQRKEEKALRAQSQALMALMEKPDATVNDFVRVAGPEKGVELYKGLVAGRQAQMALQKGDRETALSQFPALLNGYLRAPDDLKPSLYPHMREIGIQSGMVTPDIAPEEHTPEVDAAIKGFRDAYFPTQPKYEKVGDRLLDLSGEKPTVAFEPPAAPPKPVEPKVVGHSLVDPSTGRLIYRDPETPKPVETTEYELSPEGVVLSSYGTKDKNEVRKQARERGLPVFENASTQTKGMALAGIAADAKELEGLLSDPEVQASVGPVGGRWTNLQGAVTSLPPKVRRARQLLTSLSDSELRKRSGAQVNEKEMQRILQFATDPNKPLDHNTSAVSGILKSASRDYRALSGQTPPGLDAQALEPMSSHGNYLSTDPDAGEPVN